MRETLFSIIAVLAVSMLISCTDDERHTLPNKTQDIPKEIQAMLDDTAHLHKYGNIDLVHSVYSLKTDNAQCIIVTSNAGYGAGSTISCDWNKENAHNNER